MRCFQLFSVLAFATIASLLQACNSLAINGSTVRLYVDSNMVVTDLSSNERLKIIKDEDSLFTTFVRRGKRHALRVQQDTITTYTFLDPHRGLFGTSYDVEYLLARKEDAVPKEYHQGIEESMRKNVLPVVPLSLIWKREFAVVNLWAAQGYEGPLTGAWFIPSPWGSVGVGISIVPWVMPLFEIGYMNDIVTGDMYDATATWKAYGLCIQEPELGLYVAWRYGTMKLTGYNEHFYHYFEERPVYQASLTFYTLSTGVYSQWGRFEFRHRRNTSWSSHPDIPDLSGSYFGLHFSFHLML